MKRKLCLLIFGFWIMMPALGQVEVESNIKRLVNKIEKYNRIDSRAVGYGGVRTEQYDRFIKLTEKATTEELLELMNHKSPVVRGYSFWALAKRHYEHLDSVYKEHQNDNEEVDQLDGCIGGKIWVSDFIRWVVTPSMLDTDCKKLTNR